MTSFERAQRFLASGWKELDTCIQIHIEVRKDMDYCQADKAMYQTLKETCHELEHYTYAIAKHCTKLNPVQKDKNGNTLPRVAWLPKPVLDEDTGTVVRSSMPELPEFDSVEKKAIYLKCLADSALKDEDCLENTGLNRDNVNRDTTEKSSEQSTPAQAALNAIRSRRKKKQ